MIDYYERRAANPSPAPQWQRRLEQIRELPRKEQEFILQLLDTGLDRARRSKGQRQEERHEPCGRKNLGRGSENAPGGSGQDAERLIASLDTDTDTEVETAWQQEVQQRLRAVENGEVTLLSWEQVRRKLRGGSDARD
jgi:putative addiction module component (TIGR02574 family)